MKELNKTRLIQIVLASVFLAEAIASLGIAIFLRKPSFFENIAKTAFSKQPETFTEFYFTDHLNLPKEIELGVPYAFEFTVHNLEYRDFSYIYEVTNDNFILTRGQLSLKHDEIKTIPVVFRLFQPFERTKITVNLTNKNQPIHFWAEGI